MPDKDEPDSEKPPMYQPEGRTPSDKERDLRSVFRVVTSATEAEEHLRVIRQAMERSTKHSTLSGFSGIAVGVFALAGYLLTRHLVLNSESLDSRLTFIAVWAVVLCCSILADVLLTKRRAAQLGKTPFSSLGKHLARAAAPGFFAGLAMTVFYAVHPGMIGPYLYGVWMLCYAVSLLSVGMFSVREVSWLGWAFLVAGFLTFLLPVTGPFIGPRGMVGVTFGCFHILYGIWMGCRYGW